MFHGHGPNVSCGRWVARHSRQETDMHGLICSRWPRIPIDRRGNPEIRRASE
ncbi:hypothetical protein D779_3699 [Imhoffiella purpurea]|uniref:Uncharacterized protein n=1 Tax=Imhoffiella purpurea TaxID=1249627 RepID=W9V9D6_9GAMM|nr:hypothetical protein D779_3699 [Imhoffiella purpurea]